jgi:hypothetical protein
MSSDRAPRVAGWLALGVLASTLGCAGFRRGEPWDDAIEGPPPAEESGDDEAETSVGEGSDDGGSGSSDSGSSGSATSGDPADGPSFAADVLPLLDAGCERCHASDGAASHTGLLLDGDEQASYEMTLEFVDLEHAAQSRLLTKGAGQGHTGGVIYDDHGPEYATILAWIEGGALP